MLAKKLRLPATTRLSRAENVSTREFFFKYSQNEMATPRVGVVISKRVDKRATKRNELRRLLHQIIQEELSSLGSYDMLFVMKAQAATSSKEDLQEAIRSVLKKVTL